MGKETKKKQPKKDLWKWKQNRRSFIQNILAVTAITLTPWWVSCQRENNTNQGFSFSVLEQEILSIVQEFLFPNDGNGPGTKQIKSLEYLQWVLLDPEIDKEEAQYIRNGIAWVNETAEEEKSIPFLKLSKKNQQEVLAFIAKTEWGESWYSVLLTFIFEALLSDPIYGGNKNEIAWQWLNHKPSVPRPKEEQKYGLFLANVNEKNHPNGK